MAERRGPVPEDVVEVGRWTVDPRVRQALTLQAAERAFRADDPSTALALAEELLDADPDDVEALLLVAEAAPSCGQAEVAVLASAQLRRRGQDPGAAEPAALFAAGRLPEALLAAEQVVERHPDEADAHAVLARILLQLGQPRQASAALQRASELDPVAYPAPLDLRAEEWDGLLVEALSGLSRRERSRARELDIRFEDIPELDDLRAATHPFPSLPPSVDGLLLHAEEADILKFYRRNLSFGAETTTDVVDRMRAVLEGELAGEPG